MPKKNRLLAIATAAIVLALGLVLIVRNQTHRPNASAGQLRIGAILPQTGPGAALAKYIQNGCDMAASDLNGKKPGTVELMYGDSKNQPGEGVAVFRQMVLTQNPPVIISATSLVTKAIVPLAKENKTVVVATAVALPNITDASDYVFRIYPEANGMAGVMAEYAAAHYKTAVVVYVNDDFGMSSAKVFARVLESNGGKVVATEPFSLTEVDFRNQWAKIKQLNVDCVWIVGYGPAYAVLLKQAREAQVGAALLADMTMGLSSTLKNAGDAAEGVVYVDGVMNPDFVTRYQAKFGDFPSTYAGYAYDLIMILGQVSQQQGRSVDGIRSGLAATKSYKGVMGDITVLPNRDAALKFAVMRISNGKAIPQSR
jgi:branched-chain amino acid transport system substrate-binding protein